MTIKIKDQTQVSTILESGTTLVNNAAPEVFFSRNDWNKQKVPVWITNEAAQRDGDFKHFQGFTDGPLQITCYLYGSNRNTNLKTLQDIEAPIYLDANDIDSNVSGLYIIRSILPNRNEKAQLITASLFLEEYNN